ncbi:SpoIIE family protein phosphatase [Kitasatospora sp. NPDC001574]
MTDARGHVVAWSSGASRLLGLSAAEAVGRSVVDLLGMEPHWLSCSDEWHGVLPVRRPEARRTELGVRAHRLAGEDDRESLWLLVEEPAEVFPADHALADWVFTGSPVAVAIYDTGMRCVRQSVAMRSLTGVSDEERVGRGLSAVLTGPDVEVWEARMRLVLETGQAEEGFVVRGRTRGHPDHDRVLSASASPLRDQAGRVVGVCATVIDTTEQYDARARLALLNEASAHIGRTLDVTRTGQELAEIVVPRLADFVSVDLVEALLSGDAPAPGPVTGAVLRRVAHESVRDGTPEAVVTLGDRDFYTANSPQARCLSAGRSEWHPTIDEAIGTWVSEDPVRRDKLVRYGMHSWIVVPVRARGTTLGVVVLVRTRHPEPFSAQDLSLAEELVARAAVCLDNARRFTRERATALALQRGLLPQRLPDQSAVEVAFRYLPGDPELGVGGDWFDVIPLSSARVALIVGDVVGHGLRASATMGRLRAAVRTLADIDLAPDELLTQLDDVVIRMQREEGQEVDEISATCLYAVYDPISRLLTLASAGHVLPTVVTCLTSGSGGPRFRAIDLGDWPIGPPLGLGGLPFEASQFELPEGSLLALYTDGLVRSHERGVDDAVTLLHDILVQAPASLEDTCDELLSALLPGQPSDDVALLVVRTRALDSDHVATWDVRSDPAVVSGVREQVSDQLARWGLDDISFATELVVSELVTNAIRYGKAPVRLRLILQSALTCETFDASSTAPHMRRARTFDEGGRGLQIVAQLTERWGTRHTRDGKAIWAEQSVRSHGRRPGSA